MEITECKRLGQRRYSVEGKRKMNVLLLFSLREILKWDRFYNLSCGKKDQKRFSHETQVKKSTLPKKVEINQETDNIVSLTNTNLVTTTTQSTVQCNTNLALFDYIRKSAPGNII